ncbi:M23 family metallopeptidase [cf. Phormidesmis sp. LEGE 11477]|uniref:M23 family metallopeptidase n=1 Tax=cf. Phormidesmis sp. LEGE 11477 TaxID=1828680 RepID=UPI00187F8AA3|nr:M23 family metallopeptidase [cf. Phormidesmis sp. LEGE 11477]MBE9062878.1 M23 family metallopeptidase [cf. Phormidesmis sp. LEGE 11477]
MGYDPQRHWEAGDRPADVFVLGDFQSSLGAQSLSLDQISQMTGSDLSTMRISDVPFLQGRSVAEVAEATPILEDFTMEEIPALDGLGLDSSMTLGEAMDLDPSIGEMDFSAIAGDSAVTDVPNLDVASMESFEGWEATAISEVPGLGDVPMGSMSNGLRILSGLWGKFDMPYGPKEHTKTPTKYSITGSNKDGFAVQCKQSRGCAHIELTGFFMMHGAQWISGGPGKGQQMVNGGEGVLGATNGGKEPTGRHPYGDQFKVVLSKVVESEGSAEFSLYFKYCYRGIPDLGCTPYFLGPVPMPVLNAKEKGLIITGLLDGQGGLTSGLEAPSSWEKKRPSPPKEVTDIVDRYASSYGNTSGGSLCGDGPGGVKLEALAEAFELVESIGDGSYSAVGDWVSITPGETGRALGKYQYMSYKEIVAEKIGSTQAGARLIAKARANQTITPQEVLEGFPPDDQDSVFAEDQKSNIEAAIAAGYEGDKLLEVVGQMHHGGSGVLTDGRVDSTSVLRDYGTKFLGYYKQISADIPDSADRCKSTGTFINPSLAGINSFSRRFNPTYGWNAKARTADLHLGDDMLTPNGSELVASDSGIVTYLGCDQCDGYGRYMEVTHDGGYSTLYTHLLKRLAPDGARVRQGEVIALSGGIKGAPGSGNSSGAHMHFEVRLNGRAIDPLGVVDYTKTAYDLEAGP